MGKEFYTQPQFDEDYNVKNFFLYYKDLLNIDRLRNDKANYIRMIKSIEHQLKGGNYFRDCLFVHNGNICKEVFLCALSTFPKLTSYRYLSLSDFMDFWWGHLSEDRNSDEDSLLTFRDLRETVLCVYISKTMIKLGPMGANLVSTATERAGRPGRKKYYTWAFFDGTINDMVSIKDFNPVYEYFKGINGVISMSSPDGAHPSSAQGISIEGKAGNSLLDVY